MPQPLGGESTPDGLGSVTLIGVARRRVSSGTLIARLDSGRVTQTLEWIVGLPHPNPNSRVLADATGEQYVATLNALITFWRRVSNDKNQWGPSDSDQTALAILMVGALAIECLRRLFSAADSLGHSLFPVACRSAYLRPR